MNTPTLLLVSVLSIILPFAQAQPLQTDLYIPRNIQKAYQNQTRSFSGMPGRTYWQNRADYKIDVAFNPRNRLLEGDVTITYFNNSPDALNELFINLLPNYYKKGQIRDGVVNYNDESDGVTLETFSINDKNIDLSKENEGLVYGPTNLKVKLEKAVEPHAQISIKIKWHYTVNEGSHNRTGGVDPTTFFIAYFFPRIAVYDDIDGWDDFHYQGDPEFYNDFGDFEASIKVPGNYIVWGTGLLQNASDVLEEPYLQRFQSASQSDEVIHIVNAAEAAAGEITCPKTKNTWLFKANNVNDFSFATSDHYLWDATSLVVDKESGRRVLIDAAYNKDSKDFYQVATIARQSIEYMSYVFPAVPFPFPQMTVFNGLDEMEYPMMVNNLTVYAKDMEAISHKKNYLTALTAHEIFHSYFPFYMGINESKYAWMDEGWASFGDYAITKKLLASATAPRWENEDLMYSQTDYQDVMGTDSDFPIICNTEITKSPVYWVNSYAKVGLVYLMLEDALGEAVFKSTMQEYMNRWNGKHPMPYDFFFTFNQVCGQNLDWFFKPWFFEFGYPDLAIAEVSQQGDSYKIRVEKIGNLPVPIQIKVTFEDGSSESTHEKVTAWKQQKNIHFVNGSSHKKIVKVELGSPTIPDADPKNNVFTF